MWKYHNRTYELAEWTVNFTKFLNEMPKQLPFAFLMVANNARELIAQLTGKDKNLISNFSLI